jgi:hypothetical protein
MPRCLSDAIRRPLPGTLSSQQQFRLTASLWQKRERKRSAIQFNEGALATGAQIVWRAGNQLLTGSGIPGRVAPEDCSPCESI